MDKKEIKKDYERKACKRLTEVRLTVEDRVPYISADKTTLESLKKHTQTQGSLAPLYSPSPCVTVDHIMLRRDLIRTDLFLHMCPSGTQSFSFIPSTPHFPTTPATSLFPTLISNPYLQLILSYYSIFQYPSYTHSHHSRTSSSHLSFLLLSYRCIHIVL